LGRAADDGDGDGSDGCAAAGADDDDDDDDGDGEVDDDHEGEDEYAVFQCPPIFKKMARAMTHSQFEALLHLQVHWFKAIWPIQAIDVASRHATNRTSLLQPKNRSRTWDSKHF
jgi:hypothetical protein